MLDPTVEAAPIAGALGGTEVMAQTLASDRPSNCADLQPVPVRYAIAKRALDVVGSFLLLLLFLPLFVVLSILVKVSSPGPIFYRSKRLGLCGTPFTFIKFRSMRQDADKLLANLKAQNEKDGPIFKMKNDPRITKIGAFMRKYSLDELPQIWSVLIGDMTLVGPRPPIPREVCDYDDFALQRLRVKPGITCYWQIMGRSNLTFEQWMELDNRYIQEMNFWLDLKIILKTPWSVIRGSGAY